MILIAKIKVIKMGDGIYQVSGLTIKLEEQPNKLSPEEALKKIDKVNKKKRLNEAFCY